MDEGYKPYICTESDHFKLVLPELTYEAGTQDHDIPALELIPAVNGTKYDKAVPGYCYAAGRTTKEIAAYQGIRDSGYLRKSIPGERVSAAYLIEMTISRSKAYKTNPGSVLILEMVLPKSGRRIPEQP